MISKIPGILVGHASDYKALTGCTVILCPGGGVAGVDVRGGAPGTRETDCIRVMAKEIKIHGILLTGGSAFGLAAADGVMRFLEDQGIGYDKGVAKIPIVPAAVIFDLRIGNPNRRPDFKMGYRACRNAANKPQGQGNIGAGTGATVGKILLEKSWMKSGLGTAHAKVHGRVGIGALAVVNAFGDVIDESGEIVAGSRVEGRFVNTSQFLKSQEAKISTYGENTTLVVVATNARLSKDETNRVSSIAHNGIARAISPSHTYFDGDTIFTISVGRYEISPDIIAIAASEVVAEAIRNAVRSAESVRGVIALRDI